LIKYFTLSNCEFFARAQLVSYTVGVFIRRYLADWRTVQWFSQTRNFAEVNHKLYWSSSPVNC